MPFVALGFVLLAPVLALALLPVTLVLRYRAGRSRRRARGFVAAVNALGFSLGAALFLTGAALTSLWIDATLKHAAAGLAAGGALGIAGLAAARWEDGRDALHFTENRWLVLGITLVVAARIAWGFWRGWSAWQSGADHWAVANGAVASLAAGGLVLGYSLVFSLGVTGRLLARRRARHRAQARAR
jgi:hypothetical protein